MPEGAVDVDDDVEMDAEVQEDDELDTTGNGFDTSEVEVPEGAVDVDEDLDVADDADADDADVADDADDVEGSIDVDDDDVEEDVDDVEVDVDEVEVDVDDEYVLPEIVPATEDGEDAESDGDDTVDEIVARESEVSDDILEELRRADIDGPIVDFAPQDDTTSARRRPKRRPDYDPAPVPIPAKPPRLLGRKPRVRKVTRVVRHVDPWSVFKIAAMAFMVLYVILLTAGVLLWNVAYATGTVDNVERFFESFGWSSFEFNGGEIYHASWIAGLFMVVGFTGLAVLTATLFNLITDIVGGMRFTVLEEEVVETRTSPMRRFVVRRPEPEVPAHIEDSSGAMIREAVVDDTGAVEKRA